jgi:hypothetical protein
MDMRAIGYDVNVLVDARTVHHGSFGYETDFAKLATNYMEGNHE